MPTVPAEPTDSPVNIPDSGAVAEQTDIGVPEDPFLSIERDLGLILAFLSKSIATPERQKGSERAKRIIFSVARGITGITREEFMDLDEEARTLLGEITASYVLQLYNETRQTVESETSRGLHNQRLSEEEKRLEILITYLERQNLREVGKVYIEEKNIWHQKESAFYYLYTILHDIWLIPEEGSAELPLLEFMAEIKRISVIPLTKILLHNIAKLNDWHDQNLAQLYSGTLLKNINLPVEFVEYAKKRGLKTLGDLIGHRPFGLDPNIDWRTDHLDDEGQELVRRLFL